MKYEIDLVLLSCIQSHVLHERSNMNEARLILSFTLSRCAKRILKVISPNNRLFKRLSFTEGYSNVRSVLVVWKVLYLNNSNYFFRFLKIAKERTKNNLFVIIIDAIFTSESAGILIRGGVSEFKSADCGKKLRKSSLPERIARG